MGKSYARKHFGTVHYTFDCWSRDKQLVLLFRKCRCFPRISMRFREWRCVSENLDVFPKIAKFSENLDVFSKIAMCFRKCRCFPRISFTCASENLDVFLESPRDVFPKISMFSENLDVFPRRSHWKHRDSSWEKKKLTASQETSNVVFFFCYNYGWSLVQSNESRSMKSKQSPG